VPRGLKPGQTNNPEGRPTNNPKGAKRIISARLDPDVIGMIDELTKQKGLRKIQVIESVIKAYYQSIQKAL